MLGALIAFDMQAALNVPNIFYHENKNARVGGETKMPGGRAPGIFAIRFAVGAKLRPRTIAILPDNKTAACLISRLRCFASQC